MGSTKPHSSTIHIFGQLKVKEGNCMPGPHSEPCKFIGKKGSILFTTPAERYSEDNLVLKLETNTKGEFEGNVPRGNYSIFIDYKGLEHCNNTICNTSCLCSPLQIGPSYQDSLIIKLDLATY